MKLSLFRRGSTRGDSSVGVGYWVPFLFFVVLAGFLPILLLTLVDPAHRLREQDDRLFAVHVELSSAENDQRLYRLYESLDFIDETTAVLGGHTMCTWREVGLRMRPTWRDNDGFGPGRVPSWHEDSLHD